MSQLRLMQSSRIASSLESVVRLRWYTVYAPISMPLALSVLRSFSDMTPGWPTTELMMKNVAFMSRLSSCCAAAICDGRPSSNVNVTVVLGAARAELEENARKATSANRPAARGVHADWIGRGGARRLAPGSALLVTLRIAHPPAADPLYSRLD